MAFKSLAPNEMGPPSPFAQQEKHNHPNKKMIHDWVYQVKNT